MLIRPKHNSCLKEAQFDSNTEKVNYEKLNDLDTVPKNFISKLAKQNYLSYAKQFFSGIAFEFPSFFILYAASVSEMPNYKRNLTY